MVDIVTNLTFTHSLLRTSKFVDANHITVFTSMEVTIYDGETTSITRLWHVPLTNKQSHHEAQITQESINNVYNFPSKSQIVAYYHAVAGYPTQPTWIAAIRVDFYASWSLLI